MVTVERFLHHKKMDVKFSVSAELLKKIRADDWEYGLDWELAQQRLFISLKRLKMSLILNEPADIMDSVLQN